MAEFSKYKAYGIGRLFQHNNRQQNDGVQHSNESIDNERTVLNYHFKKGSPELVNNRLSEVFKMKREDAIVLGEIIVTLPHDVKPEDERDFFQSVYDFYCKDFGEENVMNAVVHKDENSPHIHLDFIPVVKGTPEITSSKIRVPLEEWQRTHNGEMPTERVCCKELMSKEYLSQMHFRLAEYVANYLGYEVSIINGATDRGNHSILTLKNNSLQKKIEELENKYKALTKEIGAIVTSLQRYGIDKDNIGIYPLLQKIEDLTNQNQVLKDIITRQGYKWTHEDIERIQSKKYVPAKSARVNFFEGSLVHADIESNAVVVIELSNNIKRPSPQEEMIIGNIDLEMQARFVSAAEGNVISRQSRKDDKIYVFIKTDNKQQTMENLFQLEKVLQDLYAKEGERKRKLYMDRMETDEYDLARSILEKNEIEANYFSSKQILDKIKSNSKEASKEL